MLGISGILTSPSTGPFHFSASIFLHTRTCRQGSGRHICGIARASLEWRESHPWFRPESREWCRQGGPYPQHDIPSVARIFFFSFFFGDCRNRRKEIFSEINHAYRIISWTTSGIFGRNLWPETVRDFTKPSGSFFIVGSLFSFNFERMEIGRGGRAINRPKKSNKWRKAENRTHAGQGSVWFFFLSSQMEIGETKPEHQPETGTSRWPDFTEFFFPKLTNWLNN